MIENIKELRYEKSGVILFNSYSKIGTEVLSNLHLCRMQYEGKVFHSSEQLFYWLRLTGYPEHQEALLQCSTPKETKRMGERFMKKLGLADDIYRDVQLLRLAIRVKYNCCREFVIGKNVCGRIIKGVRDEPKDENGLCIITRPECLDTMRPLTLFS